MAMDVKEKVDKTAVEVCIHVVNPIKEKQDVVELTTIEVEVKVNDVTDGVKAAVQETSNQVKQSLEESTSKVKSEKVHYEQSTEKSCSELKSPKDSPSLSHESQTDCSGDTADSKFQADEDQVYTDLAESETNQTTLNTDETNKS